MTEKAHSMATSWVQNLAAWLDHMMAAKMVEASLDCSMVPAIQWAISMEHWLAFWMVALSGLWMAPD